MTVADSQRPAPAAMTIAEVAALTRTGKTFVWGEIRAGRLEVVRLGQRVTRVRVVDYLAWIERAARPPEVPAGAASSARRGR